MEYAKAACGLHSIYVGGCSARTRTIHLKNILKRDVEVVVTSGCSLVGYGTRGKEWILKRMPKCTRGKCHGFIHREGLCHRHWHQDRREQKQRTKTKKDAMREVLLKEQGFVCANPHCGAVITRFRVAHLDHDHACCGPGECCIKCVRGLLCRDRNMGLGFFRDDINRLKGAIMYLESFQQHGKPPAIVARERALEKL